MRVSMQNTVVATLRMVYDGVVGDYSPEQWDATLLEVVRVTELLENESEQTEDVRFDGAVYDPALDDERLTNQMGRVFSLMRDGDWRTVTEVSVTTGDPPTSVSAQLRHLRKPRFGSYVVEMRPRAERSRGRFEYRLLSPSGQRLETT